MSTKIYTFFKTSFGPQSCIIPRVSRYTSTSIMSSPIFEILSHGIVMSPLLPKLKILLDPGTTIDVILPVSKSASTS